MKAIGVGVLAWVIYAIALEVLRMALGVPLWPSWLTGGVLPLAAIATAAIWRARRKKQRQSADTAPGGAAAEPPMREQPIPEPPVEAEAHRPNSERTEGQATDINAAAIASANLDAPMAEWLHQAADQVDGRLDAISPNWRGAEEAEAARAGAFGLLLADLARTYPNAREAIHRVVEAHPSYKALPEGTRLGTLESMTQDHGRMASWLGGVINVGDPDRMHLLLGGAHRPAGKGKPQGTIGQVRVADRLRRMASIPLPPDQAKPSAAQGKRGDWTSQGATANSRAALVFGILALLSGIVAAAASGPVLAVALVGAFLFGLAALWVAIVTLRAGPHGDAFSISAIVAAILGVSFSFLSAAPDEHNAQDIGGGGAEPAPNVDEAEDETDSEPVGFPEEAACDEFSELLDAARVDNSEQADQAASILDALALLEPVHENGEPSRIGELVHEAFQKPTSPEEAQQAQERQDEWRDNAREWIYEFDEECVSAGYRSGPPLRRQEERDPQIDDLTQQLEEGEEAPPDDEPASQDLNVAGLNERVELPPWRFNVKEVRCGQQEMIYDSGVGEAERHIAQGQYCQAIMTIENIGTAPEAWSAGASALLDTDGAHYEHDFDATYWGNVRDDHRDFQRRLNPGQAAPGSVWFDIPADAEPALLVLLPGPYSDNSVGIRLTDEPEGE